MRNIDPPKKTTQITNKMSNIDTPHQKKPTQMQGAHEVAYKLTIQTERLVQSKTYVNYRV